MRKIFKKTFFVALLSFLMFTGSGIENSPAKAALPPIKTVFLIMMESYSWAAVKNYPYMKTLQTQGAFANQYFKAAGTGNNLLSEPEYIWLEAGDNLGITNDDDPSANHQSTTSHLVTQLNNAGVSWKAYTEGISGNNCPLTNTGRYAVRHVPFVYFDDVTNNLSSSSSYCISHVRPYTQLATDLASNSVSGYNFIVPDTCNDMHDNCTGDPIAQGDNWLKSEIPKIMSSQAYLNGGAIFITWDNSDNSASDPIGMIILSPYIKSTGYSNSIHYDHSSMIKTAEEIFGVPLLRAAANSNTTDLSDFFTNTTPVPTSTPGSCVIPQVTGDVNRDGKVDGVDYVITINHFNQTNAGAGGGDINCDGVVNNTDLNTIISAIANGQVNNPTPTPTGSGQVQPVGVSGNWSLVFDDEFNGTSLDTSKWDPNWYVEGGNQNNVGTYASNVSVAGGNLVLTLASSSSGASVNTQGNNGFQVRVGMYAEARINFPGNGSHLYNWPAWWISGTPWPNAGEHDIAEVLDGQLTVNYHSPTGAHNQGAIAGYWGDTYYTYGIWRKASSAEVYWDGQLVKSYPTDDNGAGEELIVNVGSSGPYPAYGTASQIKVDYVRVWQ